MKPLAINDKLVEVHYPEELEPYMDRFDRGQMRGEKFQACSPFREERRPSFAVNLENGSWVDSGADSESGRKGSFITLLSFFRGESFEDTAQYLLEKYTHYFDNAETLKLDIKLTVGDSIEDKRKELLNTYSKYLNIPTYYLAQRGITEKIQSFFKTGYKDGAVIFPWKDSAGNLINVKFRDINTKRFWYASGGEQIVNYIFGLYEVKKWRAHKLKQGIKEQDLPPVWLVESETDALYLWSNGFPALAFGGASMNINQEKLLLNSGIGNYILATDNDTVGDRFRGYLSSRLSGRALINYIKFPKDKKDINDLTAVELLNCYSNKEQAKLIIKVTI